ncbi:MAG TPA: BamA/TamA family outer membrane protein [Candidatus Eisenbacteria bacterium]|jgi:outer membrane protein assembly factor BamA
MTARLVLIATLLVGGTATAASAHLDYRGVVLTRRQVEGLFATALRATPDSTALVEPLGRLVTELQNMGYLEAQAQAAWLSSTGIPEPTLWIEVHEGSRFRLANLTLDTPVPGDSLAFATSLGLEPGSWASPRALGEAVTRAVRHAAEREHPYARLGVTSLEWDSAGARVRVGGALGPEVRISRARIDGLRVTRHAILRRCVGSLEGNLYDRAAAEAARDRLLQLGLFRTVSYVGLEGESDWRQAQLVYRVEEPRYNRVDGLLGLQGQGGAVGNLRLELDNLAGTGRSAGLAWESRARGVESFGVRYAEPLVFMAPIRLEAALEQHVEDTLYTRTRGAGRVQLLLSGREKLEVGYEQERVVQPRETVEEASLKTTRLAFEWDVRNDRWVARRGGRARVEVSQTYKSERLRPSGSQTAHAGAVECHVEWHLPSGRSGRWSHAGWTVELSGAGRFSSQRLLPLFERYPLGGAATLRGHDEQELRVDRYGLSRLEWRWFLGERPYAALFWDHAISGTRVPLPTGGDRLVSRAADGVGFGLRLEAAGGLVGLDYGLEPGRSPAEGKLHFRLVSSF